MRPLLHLGPNVIIDRTFIRLGFKILLQMEPLLRLGPNVITDGALFYTWVQVLHLCLLCIGHQ